MSEHHPLTRPRNRGRVAADYTDSWHLSLFLPGKIDHIVPNDGVHYLPVMWPFRSGRWIVSTDVASMTWCDHEPENCPIAAETLDRPLGNVRKTFATLYQHWLSIPAKAWSEPSADLSREGSGYVFSGQLFGDQLVDRFCGLGTLFALGQAQDKHGAVRCCTYPGDKPNGKPDRTFVLTSADISADRKERTQRAKIHEQLF